MRLPPARSGRRALVTAMAAVTTLIAALLVGLPKAQAAPVFKDLMLPGACNHASVKLAEVIDARIAALGGKDFVFRKDEPKTGEKGYNDIAVVAAMTFFAKAIGKEKPEDVTLVDLAEPKNAEKLQAAIDAALKIRKPVTWKDKKGNHVYLWCLYSGNGHGGPDLGLLYVPNGDKEADGTWIAGCVLDKGMNHYQFSVDPATGEYDAFIWYNTGPDPDVPGDYVRYIFEYDVKKNVLKITKEKGKMKNGKFEADPTKTEVEKNPGKPPKEFKDLKLNGKPIALLGGGCLCPQSTVVAVVDPMNPDAVAIANPPATGDGSDAKPFLGADATFCYGDDFILFLPDGWRFVADGANEAWKVIGDNEMVIATYLGEGCLVVAMGDVVEGIAKVTVAPPTNDPYPTATVTWSTPEPTATVPTFTGRPTITARTMVPTVLAD